MNEQPDRGPAFPAELNLTKFRDEGYLQEINRRFLHPLGLALALAIADDTKEPTGVVKVWDGRDDPEGFVFTSWAPGDQERGQRIEDELQAALRLREDHLGFGVQPL